MRIATDRLAAVAVIREKFCLITNADLPQFDSRLEFAGHALDQFAKIDSLFRQKEEN